MHKNRHLIGSAEAAEIVGVDRSTFTRWVNRGEVCPAVELPGKTGARLFDRAEIERLADRMTEAAKSA